MKDDEITALVDRIVAETSGMHNREDRLYEILKRIKRAIPYSCMAPINAFTVWKNNTRSGLDVG